MAEYIFKTVYFPRERVRAGSSARITISVPVSRGYTFLRFVGQISSREFRMAIGDPFLEDLEAAAHEEGRSVSNVCCRRLAERLSRLGPEEGRCTDAQLPLPFREAAAPEPDHNREPLANLGVTFRESLRQAVFGWYPYVEGFSATYTRDAILRYSPRVVYDPFGGSGTTQLAASLLGLASFYSEINPFMRFVAETKTTSASWAKRNLAQFEEACNWFTTELRCARFGARARRIDLAAYDSAFPERDFFEEDHIRQLLAAKELIAEQGFESPTRSILLLACAANAVRSSNMTRRADLRRRRQDEYKSRVVDVPGFLCETVARYLADVRDLPDTMAPTRMASEDARDLPQEYNSAFDFALTSPPYLNGTNYFRNTKIELWLLGFITAEDDLASFRRRAICAGINNVVRDRPVTHHFDSVERVVAALDLVTADQRIPLLVRHYFSDMCDVLSAVHRGLVPNGLFLLDIGDSRFYGVHVPTDALLIEAAREVGLELRARHILARRHSRDKSELVQVELAFQKPRTALPARGGFHATETASIESLAARFQQDLPYKHEPFTKRNWGHPLHSLCSYQGKLKPAMAHWLVRHFCRPGQRVLDPLGGVGTIAFEAALAGLDAVSNDKSPFAATVAKAKLAPPSISEASEAFGRWWALVEAVPERDLDFASTTFGLNGSVSDFFHERTLVELLRARAVFAGRAAWSGPDCFIWAALLHVLHGNRPYALSRTSHPITPFHPKGPRLYKSVRQKVWQRIESALSVPLPADFRPGTGLLGDFRDIPKYTSGQFDAIITSPPFLGMRFDRPNWLRLWFCGWGEEDFHKTSLTFLERQQTKSTDVYREFFLAMRTLIAESGLLIIHIGGADGDRLISALRTLGQDAFALKAEVKENVQAVEQHGIRDKGLTTHHHLLFFEPR